MHKLSIQPPSSFLVVSYLREIAAEYGVNYDPDVAETSTFTPISAPTGFSVPVAPGSEFRQVYAEEGTAASASLPQGWTTSQDGLLSVKNSDASGNGAIPPPPSAFQSRPPWRRPLHAVNQPSSNAKMTLWYPRRWMD